MEEVMQGLLACSGALANLGAESCVLQAAGGAIGSFGLLAQGVPKGLEIRGAKLQRDVLCLSGLL